MAEEFHVVREDQFDGQSGTTEGHRKGPANSQEGVGIAQWMRRFKGGREVAAGAGDIAVTFDEAFPDDNVRVVMIGDAVSLPTQKTGTLPTATGFTLTAAGAGPCDWMAFWVGPQS